jgi:hypothetical protein
MRVTDTQGRKGVPSTVPLRMLVVVVEAESASDQERVRIILTNLNSALIINNDENLFKSELKNATSKYYIRRVISLWHRRAKITMSG